MKTGTVQDGEFKVEFYGGFKNIQGNPDYCFCEYELEPFTLGEPDSDERPEQEQEHGKSGPLF